ncbi:hypothetical protein TCAL_16682 [Tigriopus californicus]|uniref:Uncharacterized protein n=1 Tax=Tigriopus californicus TaxID=6832 RepID=A0A553PKH9_TIGCA|nr:uncharacterized protein LOC131889967 [Tigriopus californicus]TRY78176.1 hypothetical protein TCAL_16682 [Tigriopus californicus]
MGRPLGSLFLVLIFGCSDTGSYAIGSDLRCPPGYLVFGQRIYQESQPNRLDPNLDRFQYCVYCKHNSPFSSHLEVCTDHGLWPSLKFLESATFLALSSASSLSPPVPPLPSKLSGSNGRDYYWYIASESGYLERTSSSCSFYDHALSFPLMGRVLECRQRVCGVRFLGAVQILSDLQSELEWIACPDSQEAKDEPPFLEDDVICHEGPLKGIVLTHYDSVIEGKHFVRSCGLCPNNSHVCRNEYNPMESDYNTYYRCLSEPCLNKELKVRNAHHSSTNESVSNVDWCGFRTNGEYASLPADITDFILLPCQSREKKMTDGLTLDYLHLILAISTLMGLMICLALVCQLVKNKQRSVLYELPDQ